MDNKFVTQTYNPIYTIKKQKAQYACMKMRNAGLYLKEATVIYSLKH